MLHDPHMIVDVKIEAIDFPSSQRVRFLRTNMAELTGGFTGADLILEGVRLLRELADWIESGHDPVIGEQR